ncbi:MAG: hypothetical protein JWQ23_4264 [Herminiimonas sp.]|jgi:hypothetical protein|nr:hypothetical protein [Herminiimonas sp.]
MSSVLLRDYKDPMLLYILDELTGSVKTTRSFSETEIRNPAAGLGAWWQVGLFRGRKNLFVAFYTDRKTLVLRIGDKYFDWSNMNIYVRHEATAPMIKRLTVFRNEQPECSWAYFYGDFETRQDNGAILSHIETATATPADVLRIVYRWTDQLEGRHSADEDYLRELERRVQAGLQ